jgi:hypothetical protein
VVDFAAYPGSFGAAADFVIVLAQIFLPSDLHALQCVLPEIRGRPVSSVECRHGTEGTGHRVSLSSRNLWRTLMAIRRLVRRVALAAGILTLPLMVAAADAQNPVSISGVSVLPDGLITPLDPVSLDVFLTSSSAAIELYQPTEVHFNDASHNFAVDVFAQSGLLAILDQRHELVSLGTLSPGMYFYHVRQNGPTQGFPSVSGEFQVVPEPASAALLIIAVWTCGLWRKAR